MTKEFEEKITGMIVSRELEMIELGITLLINNCNYEECSIIIPFHIYRYGETFGSISTHKNKIIFESVKESIYHSRYFYNGKIFIKDNFCIAIIYGNIICRLLGVMKCHADFEILEKVYF